MPVSVIGLNFLLLCINLFIFAALLLLTSQEGEERSQRLRLQVANRFFFVQSTIRGSADPSYLCYSPLTLPILLIPLRGNLYYNTEITFENSSIVFVLE